MKRNIFAALCLATAALAASASHVHGPDHSDTEKVQQTNLVYTATVAAGYPIMASSSFGYMSMVDRAIMTIMPLEEASTWWNHWVARKIDKNQWVQVSFNQLVSVQAVALHGYVTSFKIQYTVDGITWLQHGIIYEIPLDPSITQKVNLLAPLSAIAIRINPFSWTDIIGWAPNTSPPSTKFEVFALIPQTKVN